MFTIKLTISLDNRNKQVRMQRRGEAQKQLAELKFSVVELNNNVIKIHRLEVLVGV